MGPSWWVACQVEVEQLRQMGIPQGVPPASQPWASGSLVTCWASGTAPQGPRGCWGGRRRPPTPPAGLGPLSAGPGIVPGPTGGGRAPRAAWLCYFDNFDCLR